MIDAQIESIGGGYYDLKIVGGDLVLLGKTADTHEQAVLQDVIFELNTWFGESPFDRSIGFPWREAVFGTQPIEGIGALLQARITALTGVDGLNEAPVLDFSPETGQLTVTLDIQGLDYADTVQIGVVNAL